MKNKKLFFLFLSFIMITFLVFPAGDIKTKKKKSPSNLMKPTGSLKITYFKAVLKGTSGMVRLTGRRSTPTLPRNSITIKAGKPIIFSWRIDACKVKDVLVEKFWTFGNNLLPGDVHIKDKSCKYYTRSLRPIYLYSTRTFTLSVKAKDNETGIAIKTKKSFTVRVIAPKITVLEPEVKPDTRQVSFFIKNIGDADYEGSVIIRYLVKCVGPGTNIDSGTIRTPETGVISLKPNQQAKAGEITLPEFDPRYRMLDFLFWIRVGPGVASVRLPIIHRIRL